MDELLIHKAVVGTDLDTNDFILITSDFCISLDWERMFLNSKLKIAYLYICIKIMKKSLRFLSLA
jgi:hypothetical protein